MHERIWYGLLVQTVANATLDHIAWTVLKTHWGQEVAQARAALLSVAPNLLTTPSIGNVHEAAIRRDLLVGAASRTSSPCPAINLLLCHHGKVTEESIDATDLANAVEINSSTPFQSACRNLRTHAQNMIGTVPQIPIPNSGAAFQCRWSGATPDAADFHRSIWVLDRSGSYVVIDGTHRMLAVAHEHFVNNAPFPRDLRAFVVR